MTMPHPSTRVSPCKRFGRASAVLGATLASLALTVAGPGASAVSGAASSTPNLTGVTINFADQFKEYQTAFTATNALKGAQYKVSWSEFVGGPPIIAAETGGSVDLGDMAETPTIFAQAANDPVKVVAITQGADPKSSPFGIVVPKGSPITKISQLRGKSIGVQEGTVEQYVLIRILQKAGIPYSAVTIDNLPVTSASTAVVNGKVDAAVLSQPLTGLDLRSGKATELVSGAGYAQTFGYLTASQSALDNPKKAAAVADFINRFYKAQAILTKNPQLAAQAYVTTYGVPLSVAEQAVKSVNAVGTPITPAVITYQQTEANTFQKLGLVPQKLNVANVFDLPYNATVVKKAGLKS
jgi:sulfonate transport system substrate-binding protein